MRSFRFALAGLLVLANVPYVQAQPSAPAASLVVSSCGSKTYPAGTVQPTTQDTTGAGCGSGGGSGSNASVGVNGATGPTSSTQIGIVDGSGNLQPASASNPVPTSTKAGARTIVALDVSTVTTGGTAVTALNAGHRTAGGFLYNPIGATINLCINEQATASGTTSAGALTCIQPGQSYNLTPAAAAVSVITSDSSHPFSGQGLN